MEIPHRQFPSGHADSLTYGGPLRYILDAVIQPGYEDLSHGGLIRPWSSLLT